MPNPTLPPQPAARCQSLSPYSFPPYARQVALGSLLAFAAILFGCGANTVVGTPDASRSVDAATPPDAAVDLSPASDLTTAPDLATPPDQSVSSDLAAPDLAVAIDLGANSPLDLSSLDHAPPADLAPAPDLLAAPIFYVSPVGDDTFGGRLAAPNGNRTDGPFATLEKARDTARAIAPSGGATVLLRGGDYFLSTPFALDSRDSGSVDAPSRWGSYPGEAPVLHGGKKITGWTAWNNGPIQKVDLGNDPDLKGANFDQLYFNGRRMTLARYPNEDPNSYSKGFLFVADVNGIANPQSAFHAQPNTLKKWQFPERAIVSIFPGYDYWNNWLKVKSIDLQTNTVTFDPNIAFDAARAMQLESGTSYPLVQWNRYFFQNVLEELDTPGEWFYDVVGHILYFWPPSDIQQGMVVVPTLRTVVQVAPEMNAPRAPQWIVLDGLTIDGGSATGIAVSGAENTTIERATVRNVGETGIIVSGGANSGALGDDVYWVGAGGIAISGGDPKTLIAAGNFATNNYVHHTGALNKGLSGYGTITASGVGNIVSHNLIHDHPRIGIVVGGNDHLVEYNRVRHVNLETQDSGCVYIDSRDWTLRGNTFRYNFVSDCGGVGFPAGTLIYPYFTFGIYLDDWTSGAIVYGNLVARTFRAGLFVHGGRDNLLYNNIVVDPGSSEAVLFDGSPPDSPGAMAFEASMWATLQQRRAEGPLYEQRYPQLTTITSPAVGMAMAGNRMENNVVAWSADGVSAVNTSGLDQPSTGIDANVYFHAGKPLGFQIDGAGVQLPEWQADGFDMNSKVGDPLFLDAPHDDYRLGNGSPAIGLGFVPIPVDQIGPQAGLPRATWPIIEQPGAREKAPQ